MRLYRTGGRLPGTVCRLHGRGFPPPAARGIDLCSAKGGLALIFGMAGISVPSGIVLAG